LPRSDSETQRTAAAEPSPFKPGADGVRVAVRLTPGAGADRVQGTALEADGTLSLKCAVGAAAIDGKANAALVKLLAKSWRLSKSSISLVQGKGRRRKLLHLAGDPATLLARLESWLSGLHG
jgi:uncharacterized protein YggU (UPF0235/DUF167 family)